MYIYVCFTNGGPKNCLPNRGALEVVRESIPKIDAISFFADIEHKCAHGPPYSGNDDHTNDRIDPILDLFLQRITISISIRSDPQSKFQRRHGLYSGHETLFSHPTSNLNNSGRVCPIYLTIGELRVPCRPS